MNHPFRSRLYPELKQARKDKRTVRIVIVFGVFALGYFIIRSIY